MNHKTAGLICAGGVSQSFLARLPSALAAVGPVLSISLRVARRMANSLRTGHAVEDVSALTGCEAIWIAVPDSRLDRVIAELRTAALHRKIVIVCDSRRDSASVAIHSACIATLNAADPGERVFAAEGHVAALRMLRRVMAHEKRKLIELRPSAKPLFFAGVNLSGQLLLPCFGAGVESLRKAGFARRDAAQIAAALAAQSLRAYSKAGRKAWSPSAATALREALERELKTVCHADPRIASLYHSAIEQALRYFES